MTTTTSLRGETMATGFLSQRLRPNRAGSGRYQPDFWSGERSQNLSRAHVERCRHRRECALVDFKGSRARSEAAGPGLFAHWRGHGSIAFGLCERDSTGRGIGRANSVRDGQCGHQGAGRLPHLPRRGNKEGSEASQPTLLTNGTARFAGPIAWLSLMFHGTADCGSGFRQHRADHRGGLMKS